MKSHILVSTLASVLLATPALAGPEAGEDLAAAPAACADADVTYQVIFRKGERILGAPTVGGRFGREVVIEIPNAMRVTVAALAPDEDGRSHTTARMAVFEDDAWGAEKKMEMRAVLSSTPSFEYSVDGTDYRFVVMPRLVAEP